MVFTLFANLPEMRCSAGNFTIVLLSVSAFVLFGAAVRPSEIENELFDSASGNCKWCAHYCVQFHIKEDCEATALAKEKECEVHWSKMAALDEASYNKEMWHRIHRRCEEFAAVREDILYGLSHPMPDTIGRAAKVCSPKARQVCEQSTCPTYCKMTDNPVCTTDNACKDICAATSQKMWKTGSINCEDGQTWAKCFRDHLDKLAAEKRIHQLEAISREHVLKCMCVSRGVAPEYCGLENNQKWCEYSDTPSWRFLKASKNLDKNYWEKNPECFANELAGE